MAVKSSDKTPTTQHVSHQLPEVSSDLRNITILTFTNFNKTLELSENLRWLFSTERVSNFRSLWAPFMFIPSVSWCGWVSIPALLGLQLAWSRGYPWKMSLKKTKSHWCRDSHINSSKWLSNTEMSVCSCKIQSKGTEVRSGQYATCQKENRKGFVF